MNPEREERERTMTAPKKMIVTVDPKAYWKMSHWAAQGGKLSREFIAFARTQMIDQRIYITDTYLVKHEGSSTGVEADDADVNRLIFELDKAGVPSDEGFGCWVHSHPGTGDSATYLSGTDENNIEEIMTGDRMVSIVFDSKGEHPYCRVDFREPRWSVEAEIVIWPYISAEEVDQATEEFKEKSRAKSYSPASYEGGLYGSGAWTNASSTGTRRYGKGAYSPPGKGDTNETWWERQDKKKEKEKERQAKASKASAGKGQAPKKPKDKVKIEEEGPYSEWEDWYAETEAELHSAADIELETLDDKEADRQLVLARDNEKAIDEICSELLSGSIDCLEAVAQSQTLGLSLGQARDELEYRLNMTLEEWEDEDDEGKAEAKKTAEENAVIDEVLDAIISLDPNYDGKEDSKMTEEELKLEDMLLARQPLRAWFKDSSHSRLRITGFVSDGTYSYEQGITHLEDTGNPGISGLEAKTVLDAYLSRVGYVAVEGDTEKAVVSKTKEEKPTSALALVSTEEKKTYSIDDEVTQRRIGHIAMNVFEGNCNQQVALNDLVQLGISMPRSEQILQARLDKLARSVSKGEVTITPKAPEQPQVTSNHAEQVAAYFSYADEVAAKVALGELSLADGVVVMEAAGFEPGIATLTLDRLLKEKQLDVEYADFSELLESFEEEEEETIGIEKV
jgi:hypothetical protein